MPRGVEQQVLPRKVYNDIRVRKEGVHFDLAHLNRIEWEEDKLDDFRKALENRIKAVIV